MIRNVYILKTACMEKLSSLMQIPSKTTKETHGHIGKSFFFVLIYIRIL